VGLSSACTVGSRIARVLHECVPSPEFQKAVMKGYNYLLPWITTWLAINSASLSAVSRKRACEVKVPSRAPKSSHGPEPLSLKSVVDSPTEPGNALPRREAATCILRVGVGNYKRSQVPVLFGGRGPGASGRNEVTTTNPQIEGK